MTSMVDVPEQRDETPTLSADEVCRFAGITYRRLDYWLRAEHVRLDSDHERLKTPGSGVPRRFTLLEAQRFATVGRLLRAGLSLHHAAAIARRLEENNFEPIALAEGVVLQVQVSDG